MIANGLAFVVGVSFDRNRDGWCAASIAQFWRFIMNTNLLAVFGIATFLIAAAPASAMWLWLS